MVTFNFLLISSSVNTGSAMSSTGRPASSGPAPPGTDQIVNDVAADDQQVGIRIGAKIGDAITDELVRIHLVRIDFVEQLLGPAELLEPAFRRQSVPVDPRVLSGLVFEVFHG